MAAEAAGPPLVLRTTAYDGVVVRRLEAEVQAEYVIRYGGPDETPVDPAEFAPPEGAFVVAYGGAVPVAMGGYRRHDGESAEIKRMFVAPGHRGRGFARAVLAELERLAAAAGYRRMVLETGLRQPEAIALYESTGYARIPGFGHYRDSPLNRCFARPLTPPLPGYPTGATRAGPDEGPRPARVAAVTPGVHPGDRGYAARHGVPTSRPIRPQGQ